MPKVRVALAGMLATVLLTAADGRAAIVTFENIGGETGDPFIAPYSEAGFQVAPITGRWLKGTVGGKVAGNPQPVIYGDTFTASLEVTSLAGKPFTFTSLDLASWHFDGGNPRSIEYTIDGLLRGRRIFSTTGIVSSSENVFPAGDFETIRSPSSASIDTLRISMVRLDSQAYVLDNIEVAPVPEPASVAIWLGIAAAYFTVHRRRRA